MAYRVYTAMNAMQSPCFCAARYSARTHPGRRQLPVRHDALLPSSDFCNLLI